MQITTTQKIPLKVSATTASGHPARLDGPVRWASTDPAVTEVVVDPEDSTKAVAFARGRGSAQVSAVADANLGDGVRELNAFLDVQVLEEEAAIFAIEAGAAEEQ